MRLLTAALLLVACAASAAEPPKVYTLTLSDPDVGEVLNGLAELPLKRSMRIFNEIYRQVQEQQAKPAAAPAVPPKPEEPTK